MGHISALSIYPLFELIVSQRSKGCPHWTLLQWNDKLTGWWPKAMQPSQKPFQSFNCFDCGGFSKQQLFLPNSWVVYVASLTGLDWGLVSHSAAPSLLRWAEQAAHQCPKEVQRQKQHQSSEEPQLAGLAAHTIWQTCQCCGSPQNKGVLGRLLLAAFAPTGWMTHVRKSHFAYPERQRFKLNTEYEGVIILIHSHPFHTSNSCRETDPQCEKMHLSVSFYSFLM